MIGHKEFLYNYLCIIKTNKLAPTVLNLYLFLYKIQKQVFTWKFWNPLTKGMFATFAKNPTKVNRISWRQLKNIYKLPKTKKNNHMPLQFA